MGHAWLDSLSEDWVSQPGSVDASIASPTPFHDAPATGASKRNRGESPLTPSRIPRLNRSPERTQPAATGNSSGILSERSVNEIVNSASRKSPPKPPSKLSQEIKVPERGRFASRRSVSASTTGSIVHNTVQKSFSASPSKRKTETPEWKRRLVYGELSYGEQPDLFTSAGTGLENIFKPPVPAPEPQVEESYQENSQVHHETTLPSSPPLYTRDPSTVDIHVDESVQELPEPAERRAPTLMRYRRTDDSEEPSIDSALRFAEDSCSRAASITEQTAFSPHHINVPEPESRKASGRSDVRHEEFSPILLERRQASNGKETFGPADLPPDELRARLENLRRNQILITGEYKLSNSESNAETTENFQRLGGFVNFQRGGRSGDSSFRNHVLSSGINDTSELCPEESLQASTPKQFPTVRMEAWDKTEDFSAISPDVPRPPNPSPLKRVTGAQGSTGSPLKLFQPYDTFTNQTLLRRLSQFQGDVADGSAKHDLDYPNPRDIHQAHGDESHDQEDDTQIFPQKQVHRFGTGHFDGYEFNDEYSYQSNDVSGLDADRENVSPRENSVNSRVRIFDLSHDSPPLEDRDELQIHRKRQKSINSASSKRSSRPETTDNDRALHVPLSNAPEILATPRQKDRASEIKRPRTSPSKDPTPKRRRTLHRSDVAYGSEEYGHQTIDSVQISHQQMQSIIGKKRKDVRHGDKHGVAQVEVHSHRQMLRPRTPTPTQRGSVQRERSLPFEVEKSPSRSTRKGLPPPPQLFGSSVESERKPSIKTEDFINEANKIMAMIRSKAGQASGLGSLEESEAEHVQQQGPEMDSSYQSTQEPFSRPPSREGRPPITRMLTKQEDPELVERLKKYEEASDMGDIIGSSVRSATLAQEAIAMQAPRARTQGSAATMSSWGTRPSILDANEVSDPPNVRISHSPDWQPADTLNSGILSHGSTGSHSTGRSIPTGSSRGSGDRRVIAPESVSHLIPDQVGNMVLDKQRNIWIKRKHSSLPKKPRSNYLPSEASEDDPFADIPDLTVDMTLELQNLKLMSAQKSPVTQQVPPTGSPQGSPTRSSVAHPIRPPVWGDAAGAPSDGQQTRATGQSESQPAPATMADSNEVEHEISINEDRVDARKRRNLTISFSSPIASIIQDRSEGPDTDNHDDDDFEKQSEDFSQDSIKRGRNQSLLQSRAQNASRSRSRSQGPARHLSVRGQTFMARPVSRIDEREEESVLDKIRNQHHAANRSSNMELSIVADSSVVAQDADGARQTSLSFVVTTPARPQDCPATGVDAAPIISQYVGTLSLSPLSEFTVHHSSEESLPLEASYVVGDHHLVTGTRSKRVLSMNTRDLVAKIAEVEPFEPYWEDMRELELREKRLESIHALNEFCTSLEKLDVSKNGIRNLNGIPSTVRHLKITHNQLSSLTAWGHLIHLQYVDVSNNGITSLAAFSSLVHLRSLKVDNNELTSLDGVKFHEGLQTLRARGNAIEELDFDGNRLESLTDLDLKNNKIRCVINIEQLPVLESLGLEGNKLESFAIASETPFLSLRYLRLDDNKLSSLDLKFLPHLRLMHADRNRLSQINGFSRARRIDSLSLREQRGEQPLDLPHLLFRAYEVRKLFLSGNFLGHFLPTIDLLNMQLLELANCGLQSLPEDLGLMLPNLRAINLNMNALSDLSPLRCIPRLKRILVSGNRITDSAALVDVLGGFGHLREVDLRDNPVTLGFYAPVQVIIRRPTNRDEETKGPEPFVLPDQEKERDEQYCSRLDMGTRMRRRLYEQMIAGGCKRVRKLDGLNLVAGRDGVDRRDAVWKALRASGFVTGDDDDMNKSGRWPAEDSFA